MSKRATKTEKHRRHAIERAQYRVINQCWRAEADRSAGEHGLKKEHKIAFILSHFDIQVNPNWTKSERQEAAAVAAKSAGYKSKCVTKRAPTHKTKPIKSGSRKKSADIFYASWDWKKLRYEALKIHGTRCQCCGWQPGDTDHGRLVVDHIKPRSKFPALQLDLNNLQVLCNDCNMGKSNIHEDDFRGVDDWLAQIGRE